MEDNKSALSVVSRNSKQEVERAKRNKYQRLAAEALAMEKEDAKSSGNLGFVAKWVVFASLPYRNPVGNPPAWGRRSGDVSLMIQPGFFKREVAVAGKRGRRTLREEVVSIGYPYGSYPRLLLAWMATEVVRTRQRELVLGGSVTNFMEQIGKTGTGGEKGTITLLKNQMQRLFSSTIALVKDPDSINWANEGFRLVDSSQIETFWIPNDPNQMSLFRSSLRLSEAFYENLIQSPVPVDLRALKVLSASPMAIDIYCWLTYRSAILQRNTMVPWESLYQQFGSDSHPLKFRENFLSKLKEVSLVYPGAIVKPDRAGVTLMLGSKPSIKKIA
ncbi:MAG: replication protein RepA [bacterium]|jgi:hypothetical protein